MSDEQPDKPDPNEAAKARRRIGFNRETEPEPDPYENAIRPG